ncbi:MAG: hypothetical protein V3V62_13300 [bacterium]
MTDKSAIQAEVDKNFAAFKNMLPELSEKYRGKFVLMRDQEVVQAFDSPGDAVIYAKAQFKDERYSVQEVTDRIVDLGYFSHAMHIVSI